MKRLGCIGSLIFYANSLVAFLLLLSFVLPYLAPSKFPTLSVLSLAVSPLILLNVVFMLYWIVRLRRQFLLSLIVLLLASLNFAKFIKFDSSKSVASNSESIRVASYNVRLFNQYELKEARQNAVIEFDEFLKKVEPEVLFIQEFYNNKDIHFSNLPHKYIDYNDSKNIFGHAIYSRYPIVNQGSFSFEGSSNNVLWVDIKIGEDTLRAYNVHLQSMRITASVSYLQESGTEVIKNKISDAFVMQENQLAKLLEHMASSPHKKQVVAGDFNNTSFSYTYKKLKGNMKDAYLEKGSGIGSTFYFDGFPLRIDYILVSPDIKVKHFKTAEETFSDHYAIWADIKLDSKKSK